MIVDFDDFRPGNHRLGLLHALHDANPAFRCTLFAIPANVDHFWWLDNVPEWCELAVHGWAHGDPPTDGGECRDWTRERMEELIGYVKLGEPRIPAWFVRGFKAPGWQISDGCYEALLEAGWWVADQPYNDDRRPRGLQTHRLGDGDHWHGHIQNVCGNGLEETFEELLERVRSAESFELVSEAVTTW